MKSSNNTDITNRYNKSVDEIFNNKTFGRYNVKLYSDQNNQNYIMIRGENIKTELWCEYKILMSYDIISKKLLMGSEMNLIGEDVKVKKDKILKTIQKYKIDDIKDSINRVRMKEISMIFGLEYGAKGIILEKKQDFDVIYIITKLLKR